MGEKHSTVETWLPQAGTADRTTVLKKLKKNLKQYGMTRQQIYEGLYQLATGPRVIVTKSPIPDYCLQYQPSDVEIAEKEKSSSPKRIESDQEHYRGESPLEFPNCLSDARVVEDDSAKGFEPSVQKIDVKDVDESQFLVRIPREAIMLNLDAREPQIPTRADNKLPKGPSTEIRLADSSVSDQENATYYSPGVRKMVEEEESRVASVQPRKPSIIEHITCVEGTLLPRTLLPSFINPPKVEKRSKANETPDRTANYQKESETLVALPVNRNANKIRAEAMPLVGKKLRLRRKFRQIFGNTLTGSEIDEEDEMVERFVVTKRKWRNRSTLDYSEPRCKRLRNLEKREFAEERHPSAKKVLSELGRNEETDASNASGHSMPLLDSSISDPEIIPDPVASSFPDSSTSTEERLGMEEDCPSLEKSKNSGTLTILVSPVNPDSPDAFAPVSLEIDVPREPRLSTATSTTQHAPSPASLKTNEQDLDLLKLLDLGGFYENCDIVLQANTISIREANQSPLPSTEDSRLLEVPKEQTTDVNSQPIQMQQSKSRAEAGEGSVSITTDQDSIDKRTPDEDSEMSVPGKEDEVVPGNVESSCPLPPQPPPLPPPSKPSVPKFRVLRPSELGSRWCPTPCNGSPPASSANTACPSGNALEISPSHSNSSSPNLPQSCQPLYQERQPSPLDYLDLMFSKTPGISRASNDGAAATDRKNPGSTNTQLAFRQSPSPTTLEKNPGNFFIDSLLGPTLGLLLSLNWCMKRNESAFSHDVAMALRITFMDKKLSLWQELKKLSRAIRTTDLNEIARYIVECYEKMVPPIHRALNTENVMKILNSPQLPMSPYDHARMQTRYRPIMPSQSSFRSPSRPYPYSHVRSNIAGQPPSFYFPGPLAPHNQRPLSISPDQQKTSPKDFSRQGTCAAEPRPSIFTEQQLLVLKKQIAIYNFLLKRPTMQPAPEPARNSQRKKQPRKKPVAHKDDTTKVENLRNYSRETDSSLRNNYTPANNSTNFNIARLEIPRAVNIAMMENCREVNIARVQDPKEVNIALMESPGELDIPGVDNSKEHNRENILLRYDKARVENSRNASMIIAENPREFNIANGQSPTGDNVPKVDYLPRDNILRPSSTERRDNHSVSTTAPMENPDEANPRVKTPKKDHRENDLSLPAVSDQIIAMVMPRDTVICSAPSPVIVQPENTFQSDSPGTRDELPASESLPKNENCTVLTVSDVVQAFITQSTRSHVSSNKKKRRTGKDRKPFQTETVPGCSRQESWISESIDVTELEERSNSIEPEIREDTEADDDSKKFPIGREDEIIIEEDEEPARIISQDVPVVTLGECESVDRFETQTPDEAKPNFSILNVGSISKEVFNNMGETGDDVATELTLPKNAEEEENENGAVSEEEINDCLQCGKPSFVVCERCQDAFYCSLECHEIHWTTLHHLICKPCT